MVGDSGFVISGNIPEFRAFGRFVISDLQVSPLVLELGRGC